MLNVSGVGQLNPFENFKSEKKETIVSSNKNLPPKDTFVKTPNSKDDKKTNDKTPPKFNNWQKAQIVGSLIFTGLFGVSLYWTGKNFKRIEKMFSSAQDAAGAAGSSGSSNGLSGLLAELPKPLDLSKEKSIREMALPDSLERITQSTLNIINNPSAVYNSGGSKGLKALLLYGEPGTGKTTFAKALAKEIQGGIFVPVETSNIVNPYVGMTEKNLNHTADYICDLAKKNPNNRIVVFFDEIDSLIMKDTGTNSASHNKVVNECKKVFSEKFDKHNNILVVGATNVPLDPQKAQAAGKSLDSAMRSRFRRKIEVPLPSADQIKKAILQHYKNRNNISPELNPPKNGNFILINRLSQFLHNCKASFRTVTDILEETGDRLAGKKATIEDIKETMTSMKDELGVTEQEIKTLIHP